MNKRRGRDDEGSDFKLHAQNVMEQAVDQGAQELRA